MTSLEFFALVALAVISLVHTLRHDRLAKRVAELEADRERRRRPLSGNLYDAARGDP